MPVLNNFLFACATVIDWVLTAYMWIVIIRAVLSWVSPDPYNPIVRFIDNITEPVLRPIRRKLPALGGLDLSPMVVLLAIIFLKSFLVRTLFQFSGTIIR